MRILHIVGTISPAAGGPSEVIRMLVQHGPPGYASEVATTDDPAAPFLSALPFPVHALGGEQKRWRVPALKRWLRANRNRFDGVIVHGLWEYTGYAAWRELAGRVPYAVFPHGMLDPYFKHAFPAKHVKKWLYWLLAEFWVLRGAYRVLFTTQAEAELAKQSFWLHQWKAGVRAIGAEAPPPDTQSLIEAFYARCPEMRGKRFLLYLGRIDPKKGPDLLLRAFSRVDAMPGRDTDLRLMMAGPVDAKYREQLERNCVMDSVRDCVHWPGMLRGDAKWGALAACEVFVLPSHQENFGVAVVEALASRKPVLITTPVNIAREIEEDDCGFVEDDTLEGACRLLLRWRETSPQERRAMAERARAAFEARYDMRRNAEAILRVFEQEPASVAACIVPEVR